MFGLRCDYQMCFIFSAIMVRIVRVYILPAYILLRTWMLQLAVDITPERHNVVVHCQGCMYDMYFEVCGM